MSEIIGVRINAEREVARVVDAAYPKPGAFAIQDETTTQARAIMVRASASHPDRPPRRDSLAETVINLGTRRS
jgi:hypothetical protein